MATLLQQLEVLVPRAEFEWDRGTQTLIRWDDKRPQPTLSEIREVTDEQVLAHENATGLEEEIQKDIHAIVLKALFSHENKIRVLSGRPEINMITFKGLLRNG